MKLEVAPVLKELDTPSGTTREPPNTNPGRVDQRVIESLRLDIEIIDQEFCESEDSEDVNIFWDPESEADTENWLTVFARFTSTSHINLEIVDRSSKPVLQIRVVKKLEGFSFESSTNGVVARRNVMTRKWPD
jgi:hypothetical protein